jgi:hypothetical protein
MGTGGTAERRSGKRKSGQVRHIHEAANHIEEGLLSRDRDGKMVRFAQAPDEHCQRCRARPTLGELRRMRP